MKNATLSLFALAAFATLPALAQTNNPPPKFAPVPPPPGLNDPGVKAVAPPSQPASTASSSPAEVTATPLPGKPIPLPAMPGEKSGQSVPDNATPDVTVHKEGDAVYQEYRRGGRVYMVVVTQKNGLSYTYTVNDHGDLIGTNGAPPVRPVMYKILQWGGSKAPAADKGDDEH